MTSDSRPWSSASGRCRIDAQRSRPCGKQRANRLVPLKTSQGRRGVSGLWRMLVALMLVLPTCGLWMERPAQGQTPPPIPLPGDQYLMAPSNPSGAIAGSPYYQDDTGIGVGGMGVMGRFGHLAGPSYARKQSITHVELAPYIFQEESMLYGDGRLYLTNNGRLSGSAGLGLRHYFIQGDFILGAGFFYDRDGTRTRDFEQFVLSTELFTEWLDVRANYYQPIGNKQSVLGTGFAAGSERFEGNNIVFSTTTTFATAAEGVDMLFSTPIPGEIAERYNLEASAGWYHFQTRGVDLPRVWGWKLRADTDLASRLLHMFVEFTRDDVFKSNLTFGADINYYHHNEPRRRIGSSQFNRMTEWVRRNYTVVSIEETVVNPAEVAINPDTGLPFFVYHVRNVPSPPPPNFPAPLGNGSLETPFQFINEAQVALPSADIIFVHADSEYDNIPVVLNDNERIFGEGVPHFIRVQNFPTPIPLPRATNGVNRPLLRDTIGTAVTLANNSEFSGFTIENTTGTAIFAGGINSANASNNIINGTNGPASHGIFLQNVTGIFLMESNTIANTQGNAFFVQGGTGAITFSDTINNNSGFAVLIENNGGSVNMTGSTITENGGLGIRVANSTANVTFDQATIVNTPGDAVDIENISGAVSILGDFNIVNAGGVSFDVDTVLGGGSVNVLGNMFILGRNDVGINLNNISGVFNSTGFITLGPPAAGGVGPAINFQNSSGSAQFNNMAIVGSNDAGINIGDRLGLNTNTNATFRVFGTTNINGTAGSAIQVLNDTSTVEFGIINIANRGSHGLEVLNHNGRVGNIGNFAISNALGSGDSAIDITGSTGIFTFGPTNATGTLGPDPGVNLVNNPNGAITFGSLSGDSTGTTFLEAVNNQSLTIGGGTIAAVDGRAVNMENHAAHGVTFTSVSSSNSPDFGIRLVDNPNGFFRVMGNGTATGTGGTITGAGVAGTLANNSDDVSLNFQIYNANALGISATLLSSLNLTGDQITDNTSFGLDTLNVHDLTIRGSTFTSNGRGNAVGLQNQLRARVSIVNPANDPYQYFFAGNLFDDGVGTIIGSDMILIQTIAGGTGAQLNFNFQDHGVPGTNVFGVVADRAGIAAAPVSALHLQWGGPVVGLVTRNNFFMGNGNDQIALEIETLQAGARSNLVVSNNQVTAGTGLRNIGYRGDFTGPVSMSVINNFVLDANNNPIAGFVFNGFQATAFDLNFRATQNDVVINDNIADFFVDDGTFLRIPLINGPSLLEIQGNTANLSNVFFNFLPGERGIIIERIVGTVNLFGGRNNAMNILPAEDAFSVPVFIPAGGTSGTIIVNGFPAP